MFKRVVKEEITIPASMAQLRVVREFIENIGKKHKFSEKIINSFKLVVDEACTNIIRHGYLDVKDGKITIRAIIRRMSLTIVIIDQGKFFDPRQAKSPDLQKYVAIGKKGGLGILMMRKLMDDIQYHRTSRGNELRLTKMRDTIAEPRWRAWFQSLSLRQKSLLVASFLVILGVSITYVVFQARIDASVKEEVFTDALALTRSFAEVSWESLREDREISLFAHAKAVKESRPELILSAQITYPNLSVKAVYPVQGEIIGSYVQVENLPVVEKVQGITIYSEQKDDRTKYHLMAPIQKVGLDAAPIGYAVLTIDGAYMEDIAASRKFNLALLLIGIGIVVTVGVALLVTLITEPFLKLAEWVRQVGRGQADEDEIDIDAGDEVGEIAQSFKEMTNKFREAQMTVVEQQRLRKELQVAQEIQQMLLPDDFPEVVGYDIASYYQSAKEVGGDLFDFVEVDENSIGICVADVSGKGVPGSLVMTMIRTSLRLEARGNKNPADVLARVNRFVTDDIRKGMFVTMFYVILDSRERMIAYASAGHNPMILYRGKTRETYYLNPPGFPVGITLPDISLFDRTIQADRIRLHPDDILVLYTDGITEAMNPKRDLYGEERFLQAIRKYGQLDVVEFVKGIKNDILNFTGGYEQNDDITLVAIKENMAMVDVKVNMFKQLIERVQADNGVTVAQACKQIGISPTTFYRYRRIYQEGGYDLLREMLHGYTNLGLRHLSIEVKTKMYDIIREHPEYGPKKIADLLNTEKYGFTEVSPDLIYEELRRAKLNTKEKRIAFVQRGGTRRLKPPGTPLLTLDGQVLVGFRSDEQETPDTPFVAHIPEESRSQAKMISARGKRLENMFEDEPPRKKSPSPEPNEKPDRSSPKEEDQVVVPDEADQDSAAAGEEGEKKSE